MPAVISPDISTLDFSALFDISTPAPTITLTNLSTGPNLAACNWWYEVITPSGTYIHQGSQGSPDMTGAWVTQIVPDVWPQPFGQIEWSGSDYKVILYVEDSVSSIFSESHQGSICRPNGNTTKTVGNFGVGAVDVQVRCDDAQLYAADTTNYQYKSFAGESVSSKMTLVYPVDENGNVPAPITMLDTTAALFPLTFSAKGYTLYSEGVRDYEIAVGITVRIKYKVSHVFAVYCNIDLCPLICEIDKMNAEWEANCGQNQDPTIYQKITKINSLLIKALIAKQQPLCGFDVAEIVEEIIRVGDFTCNTCVVGSAGINPTVVIDTSEDWSLSGNATTGTEKLGTTNGQPLPFYTSDLLRMLLLANGRWLLGKTTDSGQLAQINGTVSITPGLNASWLWDADGTVTITIDGADVEDAILVNSSTQTEFLRIGVGNGGDVETNAPYIKASGASGDFGFVFTDNAAIRSLSAINATRINFYLAGNVPTVLVGALSGANAGNSFQFVSNSINGNPSHTPVGGVWNFITLLDAGVGGGAEIFEPTTGDADLNTIASLPTLNQSGTATGKTRGFYDAPTFSTLLSRQLHRAFESNGDSNSFGVYIPLGAKFFNLGNAGFGAEPVTDKVEITGNLALMALGNKIKIAGGNNGSIGTATLGAGGTAVVPNTVVTASSIIIATYNTLLGTPGSISAPVGSIVPGVSFTLVSSNAADLSIINWWIIN